MLTVRRSFACGAALLLPLLSALAAAAQPVPGVPEPFVPESGAGMLRRRAATAPAAAQPESNEGPSSSLFRRPIPGRGEPAASLRDASWTYTPYLPVAPPKEIALHDVVTIVVSEASIMTSEGEVQRRKNGLYDAVLRDWVKFIALDTLKPAAQADGDQRVQGQLNQILRAENEIETRERLQFTIAASVVSILPNGNVVLEAHRQIRNNEEIWEYSLSGVCRRQDINPNTNIVQSEDIADLRINKRERGHVPDGYRRGWFLRWFDKFHPF